MVKRAGVPQHGVRYLGQGKIVDPWFADIADLLPRYTGKDLTEAIWAVAYYKRLRGTDGLRLFRTQPIASVVESDVLRVMRDHHSAKGEDRMNTIPGGESLP